MPVSTKTITSDGIGYSKTLLIDPNSWPRKSTKTKSALLRPIFNPNENTPFGFRLIGIEGCPTCPRCGLPLSKSPSFSNDRIITETVCADRPDLRAI